LSDLAREARETVGGSREDLFTTLSTLRQSTIELREFLAEVRASPSLLFFSKPPKEREIPDREPEPPKEEKPVPDKSRLEQRSG
jgi:hypothetical protein